MVMGPGHIMIWKRCTNCQKEVSLCWSHDLYTQLFFIEALLNEMNFTLMLSNNF